MYSNMDVNYSRRLHTGEYSSSSSPTGNLTKSKALQQIHRNEGQTRQIHREHAKCPSTLPKNSNLLLYCQPVISPGDVARFWTIIINSYHKFEMSKQMRRHHRLLHLICKFLFGRAS